MPLAVIIGGAAANVAGGVIGSMAASEDREAARQASEKALALINNIGAPPDLSKQIFLEEFKSAGILTPEMEKEINVQFEKIKAPDQKTLKAQQTALEGFLRASKGGMTPEDRVAMNDLLTKAARENAAQQGSIAQNMQARGVAGGGAELAMRLQAAQANANAASAEADRLAASKYDSSRKALSDLANFTNQMRGQEFSENQAAANITNEQNRFNVANQVAQQMRNVGAKNTSQEFNLRNAQQIMNANVGQRNQEVLRQNQAKRQFWQDQADLAKAKAGAVTGYGQDRSKQGAEKAAMWTGIGSGVGDIAGSAGQYMQQNKMMDRMYPQQPGATDYSQFAIDENMPISGPRMSGAAYWQGGVVQPEQGLMSSEAEYNKGGMVWSTDPETDTPVMGSPIHMARGGIVPGQEIVPGDHPINDVVHARLESGEYVVPKEDAPSMRLIHQILKGMKQG